MTPRAYGKRAAQNREPPPLAKNKEEIIMSAMQRQSAVGKDVEFERIRRITGYLVGTMDKWNNAKKAEEHDRVKHGTR